MLYKYILWLPVMLLCAGGFFPRQIKDRVAGPVKWVISQNSSLSVNGSTNINSFSCDIASYDQTDTLTLRGGNQGVILSGMVNLKVQRFDCHNSIMTHDLRKTLKEKDFPVLHISFLSLSKLPGFTAQPENITGWVEIELAGVRKRFEVNYKISADDQKTIYLHGSRDVNFSDFALVPPRKLGGMIQTKDKLGVVFQLKMTAVN